MNNREITVTDFINGPVSYDNEGQYFFVHNPDGGLQMLGELRGWGHIQNMFVRKGKMDLEAAAKFQDKIGEFVAQAVNEKIQRILSDGKIETN